MQEVSDKSAQDKLLQAVIELIDTGDDPSITVRDIVARAGVNVGSINYHFGSKDELMAHAVKEIFRRNLESFSMLDDTTLPARHRLEGFLVQFTEKMVECHSAFHQQMFKHGRHFKSKHETMSYLKEIGMDKIKKTIMEIDESLDEKRALMLALQLFSAAVMPNLFLMRSPELQELQPLSIQEQVHTLLSRVFP